MNDDLKYRVCHLCGCPDDDAKPLAPMLKEAFLKEFRPKFEHFCATATIEQIRALTEILVELARRQAYDSGTTPTEELFHLPIGEIDFPDRHQYPARLARIAQQ